MAGAGFKAWSAGNVLSASDTNLYLMEQSVMNFAGTAARAAALPSPAAGMVSHIGGGTVQVYNGTAWVALGGVPWASLSGGTTSTLTNPDGDGRNYTLTRFNANGTLTCNTTGYVQVLMVSGGGQSFGGAASPGNGGRVVQGMYLLPAGTYSIKVGGGNDNSTIGSFLNTGLSYTSLDVNNPTGAAGTPGSPRDGLTSTFSGSSVVYGGVVASPAANTGGGNTNGGGASGVVLLRVQI